ncbi:HNH endonuclease [Lewinella sp. 4G2]|uniref:HNH endonuclease n=1 Tax=Lewinella sp. 4G2 TaxID=1803372 RepID=UPI0007DFE1D3|nr:HNH endonuclease signature motif containing protein [Lewinella sp. 4G2]OAV44725.1 hypothetical protein A3850_009575 [Lewinella sp. 4G2]
MPNLPKPKRPAYLPAPAPRKRSPAQMEAAKFYNCQRWRSTTKRYRAANPLCEACAHVDELEPAAVTDHVVPISAGGSPYEVDNFMPLCHRHHNRKRAYELRGYVTSTVQGLDGLLPADRAAVLDKLEPRRS